MPALNFKKQFAGLVESGEKRQTIRALRKDGRNPRPGQTLYLYTGMRTAFCRKLGEAQCLSVRQIAITESKCIEFDTRPATSEEEEKIIRDDGFKCWHDFYDFFEKTHGLPFYGLLISW